MIYLTKQKPVHPPDCPSNIRGALRVLGITLTRSQWLAIDRDILFYDAHVAFKAAIRVAHSDVGGSDDAARPIIEAYRIVKRYCIASRPAWMPYPTWLKARRDSALSQI